LGTWDVTGTEAGALLAEDKDTLTADQIVELRLASATAALNRGHTESGLLVIRELLRAEGGKLVWLTESETASSEGCVLD
jgi:hypothetical protein